MQAFDFDAFDFEAFDAGTAFLFGGIGHYRVELERAKQLAAITRTVPGPIDNRSAPQFESISAAPVSVPQVPATTLAGDLNKRMGDQMRAVQALRKKREEEAFLLLAS